MLVEGGLHRDAFHHRAYSLIPSCTAGSEKKLISGCPWHSVAAAMKPMEVRRLPSVRRGM